jgi:hypothetical protein
LGRCRALVVVVIARILWLSLGWAYFRRPWRGRSGRGTFLRRRRAPRLPRGGVLLGWRADLPELLLDRPEVILKRFVRAAASAQIAPQRCYERSQTLVFRAELLCSPVASRNLLPERRDGLVQDLELSIASVARGGRRGRWGVRSGGVQRRCRGRLGWRCTGGRLSGTGANTAHGGGRRRRRRRRRHDGRGCFWSGAGHRRLGERLLVLFRRRAGAG